MTVNSTQATTMQPPHLPQERDGDMFQAGGFNVRVARKGDRYGLYGLSINEVDMPIIEFFDPRRPSSDFGARGQHVSSHYLCSIMGSEFPRGLRLNSEIPDCSISHEAVRQLQDHLRTLAPLS